MKKIKLFALAVMAMLGTNAMAATETGSTTLFKFTYETGKTDATITALAVDKQDVTALEIPAELTTTSGAKYKVVAIGENAFKDNEYLESVSIAASVATIDASAFNNCISLASVTFAEGSELATLNNFAFGTTPSLTSISFANCSKLTSFATTPFIPAAGGKNTELKEITLNGETTAIGTALANLAALTTVNLSSTKVTDIADKAFENDAALTSLTTPNTLKTIKGSPFAGCVKLATLTIDAKALTDFGDGTKNLYGTGKDNLKALTSLTISGDVAGGVIKAGVLAGCTGITTLKIAEGKSIKTSAMGDAAISVAKNGAITLGKLEFAVAGTTAPIAAGDGTTLTIGEITVAQTNEIVSGKIATTVGKISATTSCSLDAFGKTATSLTFTGDIAAVFTKYSAAAGNTELKTINFGSVKLLEGQIPEGANGTAQTTGKKALAITWTPADADAKKFIAQKAFSDATVAEADRKVTLTTTLAVGTLYSFSEANVFNVIFNSAAVQIAIPVAHKSATYYYGTFNPTANFKIAKEQNGGKVMVYGAYVDQSDNTVYMDQLHVIKGYYYVPKDMPVVVKSAKADDVIAEFDAAGTENSANYKTGSTTPMNEIKVVAKATVATTEAAQAGNEGYALLFLYPAESFDLYWNTLQPSAKVPAGTFYLRANKELIAAGGRINVVWLDGSEDNQTTAIQTIEKVANDGVIYNLAGQKVDANYKGVVIKNGKKMILK